jgi:hypothetical protein
VGNEGSSQDTIRIRDTNGVSVGQVLGTDEVNDKLSVNGTRKDGGILKFAIEGSLQVKTVQRACTPS